MKKIIVAMMMLGVGIASADTTTQQTFPRITN